MQTLIESPVPTLEQIAEAEQCPALLLALERLFKQDGDEQAAFQNYAGGAP